MITKEQIEYAEELGIYPEYLTESEFIDELLKQAHLLALSAEFNEKELSGSLKPNN